MDPTLPSSTITVLFGQKTKIYKANFECIILKEYEYLFNKSLDLYNFFELACKIEGGPQKKLAPWGQLSEHRLATTSCDNYEANWNGRTDGRKRPRIESG